MLVTEDADVYKPDGSLLLKYRKDVIPELVAIDSYNIFRVSKSIFPGKNGGNRGMAGGANNVGAKRVFRKLSDGRQSRTSISVNTANSGVIGYFDRYPRIPFCRQKAFNSRFPERWKKLRRMIKLVDEAFRVLEPQRYRAQRQVADLSSRDFTITDTAFTTLTVNCNFRTALHKDAGDLREGFGVMCAFRGGNFSGGYTIFPQFRVAVDMQNRGLLLADVHEWHCNSPIIGKPGRYKRYSCVFYFREGIKVCGTADHELEIAKNQAVEIFKCSLYSYRAVAGQTIALLVVCYQKATSNILLSLNHKKKKTTGK